MSAESKQLLENLREITSRRRERFNPDQLRSLKARQGFWTPAILRLLEDVVAGRINPEDVAEIVGWYIGLENVLEVTDSLTNVLNHEGLIEYGRIAVAEARRHKRPLVFAMFDIDNFRQFNDRYGHSVGDEVLEKLTSQVSLVKRENDVLGRWGGEEFGLILEDTNLTQAGQVLERIRRTIETNLSSTITSRKLSDPITISIGYHSLNMSDRGDDFSTLSQRADVALHVAKGKWQVDGISAMGRNRIIPWQEGFPTSMP